MARQAGDVATRASARAKFIRISPYKVRQVAALIKGKPVDEARRILAFTPKAASHEIAKVLESAVANAEHNFQIPQEELIVRFASADEGLTIPRGRPRAQGRYYRIRKRTSHINLVLERAPQAATPPVRPTRRRRGQEEVEAQAPAEETEEKPKPRRRPPAKSTKAKAAGKKSTTKPEKKPPARRRAAKKKEGE